METLPYISIRPNYISTYNLPEFQKQRTKRQVDNQVNLLDNDTHGMVSRKANKRVKEAIDWLVMLSKQKKFKSKKTGKTYTFNINFVTLTLSSKQVHSDQIIKSKLLNQFLIELKRDFKVMNYLWRAESQKNGNIHFHIVTDKFVPHDWLRDCWNRIQNKLGYIDRYHTFMAEFHKKGFKVREDLLKYWNYKSQLRAYKVGQKGNWYNPNSTDVHSIRKLRNISAYLSKYCTKNGKTKFVPNGKRRSYTVKNNGVYDTFTIQCVKEVITERPILGKLWGLSNSLSKLSSAIDFRFGEVYQELAMIRNKFKSCVKEFDYTTVYYVSVRDWLKVCKGALFRILSRYIVEWKEKCSIPKPIIN